MPKEILIQIIQQRLYFQLLLSILVFVMVWLIVLKLGFRILRENIGLNEIIPVVWIGVIYSLCGRQVIPHSYYGLIIVLLFVFFFKIVRKTVPIIKAFWTAFILLFVVGFGTVVIESPLCASNRTISIFFLSTPYGVIASSLIETIFPIILLLVLRNFDISLVPDFKRQIKKIDLVAISTFGLTFYLLYSISVRVYESLRNNSTQVFSHMITEWVSLIASIFGFFLILFLLHEQRESERRIFDLERQKFVTEKNEADRNSQRLTEANTQLLDSNTQLTESNKRLIDLNNQLIALNNQFQENNLSPRELTSFANKFKAYSESVINQLSSNVELNDLPVPRAKFNSTEWDVIKLVGQTKDNGEIAKILNLSEGYVKNIISKVLGELHLKNRTQLAVYARETILKNQ